MAKQAPLSTALAAKEALRIAFPKAFPPKGDRKKPLKIGIRKDLIACVRDHFPDMSNRVLRSALSLHCSGKKYLAEIVAGAPRVDLDGRQVDIVTLQQEQHAQAILRSKRRKSRNKEKRGKKRG